MATATQSISELLAEADQLEQDYREKRGALMARIRDAADAEAGDYQVGDNGTPTPSSSTTTTAPPPARRRTGSPPKKKASSKTSPKAAANKKKPQKKAAAKKTSGGKVKPEDRNYDNKMSLREAIWSVLDRGPDSWAKSLPDFPEDAEGLKVSEVKEIIENEKLWVSSSDNISPQVQQHLYELKKADKVARGDDRRYYIIEGATLEG